MVLVVGARDVTGAAPPSEADTPTLSNAPKVFLKAINTLSQERLASTKGLKPEVVAKIMQRRGAGRPFTTMADFTEASGITPIDLKAAMTALGEAPKDSDLLALRRPVPDPPAGPGKGLSAKGKAPASKTPGGPDGQANSNEGPIGEVRPGYYGVLPGYDLDKMDPVLKKEFLETVNRDMCSCGCSGETLAFCLVNDPGCPVVKARVKKIHDDIMAKAPH